MWYEIDLPLYYENIFLSKRIIIIEELFDPKYQGYD